uniref:Uncharacterized protein n=1 Tax=Parastrongyloides trichosuri TaxID=131310 RepID=A0A0N4ZU39_PARTI
MSHYNDHYYQPHNGQQQSMSDTGNEGQTKVLLMLVSFCLGVTTMILVLISQGRIAFKTDKKMKERRKKHGKSKSESNTTIPMTEIQKVVDDLQKKNKIGSSENGQPQIVVVQKK